ncbi:unnamed protein product [Rotaria sordida]|uniref:Dedicator of cytokinesis protein 7 n=1 Tax=Rotaria sordida TaxID=392033 RepID=A0A813S7J8_9BILA|nr:unnamed protein product [Rotaria sordida]CAF3608402.1 unnamed protein product [Rotaria sordida]
MAGTLRLREHLQEVISLLSNESKISSLPLNENKEDEEELTFTDLNYTKSSNKMTTNMIDIVDPIDYEEYVDEHRQKIENDPLHHLLEYPNDDIDFIRIDRQYRTIIPAMPEKEALNDPHIRDCLQSFNGEHFFLRRNYNHHGSAITLLNVRQEQMQALKQTAKQDYEVDLIDDNRQILIEQERDSPRKLVINDSIINPIKSSWVLAKDDLDKTEPDTIMPHLIERIPIESVDKENELLRGKNRYSKLFSSYPPQADTDCIEYRPPAEPLQPYTTFKLQVKCLDFRFEPEIEPMFITLALYDYKERKKISENFHYDLNSDALKQMIHIRPAVDGSTLSLSAIFPISFPSPDIYLIIRVEKVLQQGDLSDCAEPYIKQDIKNQQRYYEQAIQFSQRLGRFRMPFAWSAISLRDILKEIEQETILSGHANTLPANTELINSTNKASSLERKNLGTGGLRNAYESFRRSRDESLTRNNSKKNDDRQIPTSSPTSTLSPINTNLSATSDEFFHILANFDRPIIVTLKGVYKQESERLTDEDIFKFLTDFRKPPTLAKKPKTIPAFIRFEFNQIHPGDSVDCCLDPQLNRLKPYTDDTRRPIKELLEFPPREIYLPHTSYRNILYLYPLSLNLSNLTTRGSTSARNIAVKIQLMGGEEEIFALPLIFGKSSGHEMIKEIYLPVLYHLKSPSFYDEVKIRLPGVLDENHHLFFTFSHISCQPKENAPIETPIGYTWLPLLNNNQLVHGDFNLPVACERPPHNYSLVPPTNHDVNNVKWADSHKPLFSLSIRPSSTIHSLDERLENFFHMYNQLRKQAYTSHHHHHHSHYQITDKDFKQAIMDTVWAQAEKLVQFLYILLDTLLSLLVRAPILNGHILNVNQTCFETLAKIVQRIQRDLLADLNDTHGRNRLLLTYIHYECTLHTPTETDMTAVSSKSASLRPNSLYFQRRVPRSTSNPDLPSPSLSPEDEMALAAANGGFISPNNSSGKQIGEISQGVIKDAAYSNKTSQQRKPLHEELLFQWVVSSGATRDFAFGNSWFFFELLIKTMGHYLHITNRFQIDRRHRFSYQFCDDITTLLRLIIRELLDRQYHTQRNGIDGKIHCTQLNTSLAFFINDCLSLMDRGFIFGLIKIYCKEFDLEIAHGQPSDTSYYISLKLDFIRIVCSHEHYITLNLPLLPCIPPSPSPSIGSMQSYSSNNINNNNNNNNTNGNNQRTITIQQTDLTYEYRQEHYLVGIILNDLQNVLTKTSPWLHSRAINILRNVLSYHDFDQRLLINDEKNNRNRVARLYLPLVHIVSNNINKLFDPGNASFGQLNRPSVTPSDDLLPSNTDEFTTETDGTLKRISSMTTFSEETSRDLLICLLWLLKNIDSSVLRHWWMHMTREQLQNLIQLLDLSIASFEYKGKKQMKRHHRIGAGGHASVLAAISTCASTKKTSMISVKNQLEKSIIGTDNARTDMLNRTKQKNPNPSIHEPSKSTSNLRWRKDQTHWRQANIERSEEEITIDAHLESILASECTMIVLDTIETIIQVVQTTDCHQILLPGLLKILLHAFALNQSTWTLQNLFSHQRAIVYKFPELLFEEDTEHCADLCLRLLKHCSSCLSTVRSHASASLYLLMRQNFEIGNNFSRVKMQATMSLSWLVGQSTSQFNEIFLRKSLRTILTYADGDTDLQESAFPSQVKDLATNLYMILCDTVKLREAKDNPDMEIDLLHRIANCYQNSPDLRLTWLQNMAQKHLAMNHYAEAGMCLAHAASLVAEYLRMLESKSYMPDGCVALQKISMNLLEESAVSDDVVSPGDEGICTGKYFTENGFIGLMEQAAVFLTHAHMYEAVNNIYHVLTPIYEANRDFKKLSQVHSKLHEYFNRILIQGHKRLFGTYFRVGFYGTKFDELDGQEFIYKEPGITKLAEIASRLESFYIDKFGKTQVEMIKDSNDVNRASLDLANKK